MERRRFDCSGMHPNGLHWTVVAWKSAGMQPNEMNWTAVAGKSLGSSHVYPTGLSFVSINIISKWLLLVYECQ